jgi:hypothetical protein
VAGNSSRSACSGSKACAAAASMLDCHYVAMRIIESMSLNERQAESGAESHQSGARCHTGYCLQLLNLGRPWPHGHASHQFTVCSLTGARTIARGKQPAAAGVQMAKAEIRGKRMHLLMAMRMGMR